MKDKLILASESPRRRALLEKLGISFDVVLNDVDESVGAELPPQDVVCFLAERKARSAAQRHPASLVLAADTVVVLDDRILGKPESASDAARMLNELSGRTHQVYTGVALVHRESGRVVVDYEKTGVTFDHLESAEVESYVADGSPLDKAGAYGIQDDRGCLFIRGISGDYYTVVGLPLNLLYRLIKQHFPDLTIF